MYGEDQELRLDLEFLLAYQNDAEDFLELPPVELAVGLLSRQERCSSQFVESHSDNIIGEIVPEWSPLPGCFRWLVPVGWR